MANDKCNQTREAQKLAEVKVMELEQRFATAQKELKEAQDDKGKKFTEFGFPFDQTMITGVEGTGKRSLVNNNTADSARLEFIPNSYTPNKWQF